MIHLTFMPLIPVWLIGLAGGSVFLVGLYALLRRVPGSLARMLALLLLIFWLAGPRLSRPFYEPAPQDVLLVVDHSPSMLCAIALTARKKPPLFCNRKRTPYLVLPCIP